jgi:hypothetical protein
VAVNPVDPTEGVRDVRPPVRALHAQGRPIDRTAPDAEELLRAAAAVIAVAAELGRYLVEARLRRPRYALRRLPRPSLPPAARALTGGSVHLLAGATAAATRALGSLADAVVPTVVREVVSRLDLTALVHEFVDIDRLAATLDVDAVVARVDLDAVIARIDVDAIAAELDLDAVIARLDLDALVEKVDVGRIVDRLDLDEIVSRVDLDRAVEHVDLDRAVDRVDIDRIIDRADVVGLAQYIVQAIDLPSLIRDSTGTVTTDMVRTVRDQSIDADRAVERVVDRLLHRQGRRAGPPPGQTPGGS